METTTHDPGAAASEQRPDLGGRIVRTEGVRGGKPRLAGHRITVSDIAIWHERMGMSPDEIASEHPSLILSDVYAALTYYHDNRDEIDREIRESEEFVHHFRAGAPSLFDELRSGKADVTDDSVSSR
jgi:uncharacterized protein (DUF433 family)